MRIAVIGAGNVGGALGRRWAERGHEVAFGIRDPERGASAVKGGGALPARARVASPAEAARDADVIVLATPYGAIDDALREIGAATGALDGKPLLDATNPLLPKLQLDVGAHGESAAERLQAKVPRARVVKVFNTTGSDNMENPVYDGAPSAMFYAGDDPAARGIAHDLAADAGFDPIDAGTLVRARELEHLAMLWISLAFGAAGAPPMGRNFAFRVMRR